MSISPTSPRVDLCDDDTIAVPDGALAVLTGDLEALPEFLLGRIGTIATRARGTEEAMRSDLQTLQRKYSAATDCIQEAVESLTRPHRAADFLADCTVGIGMSHIVPPPSPFEIKVPLGRVGRFVESSGPMMGMGLAISAALETHYNKQALLEAADKLPSQVTPAMRQTLDPDGITPEGASVIIKPVIHGLAAVGEVLDSVMTPVIEPIQKGLSATYAVAYNALDMVLTQTDTKRVPPPFGDDSFYALERVEAFIAGR